MKRAAPLDAASPAKQPQCSCSVCVTHRSTRREATECDSTGGQTASEMEDVACKEWMERGFLHQRARHQNYAVQQHLLACLLACLLLSR